MAELGYTAFQTWFKIDLHLKGRVDYVAKPEFMPRVGKKWKQQPAFVQNNFMKFEHKFPHWLHHERHFIVNAMYHDELPPFWESTLFSTDAERYVQRYENTCKYMEEYAGNYVRSKEIAGIEIRDPNVLYRDVIMKNIFPPIMINIHRATGALDVFDTMGIEGTVWHEKIGRQYRLLDSVQEIDRKTENYLREVFEEEK